MLDVDRRACWRLEAIKGGDSAVGRTKSTALTAGAGAVGGVNADFFSFTPPGVPTGAMIHRGRVITPPVNRPVFAVDSSGRPWIGFLRRDSALPGAVARLTPFHPLEAVGGFPILVRDSIEADTLERTGSATFAPVRHPRTMVGLAAQGRRVLLVTVDGRQAGYSAGMTLKESARLMLDLGATEALNLDGGGSTTMVVQRNEPAGPRLVIANRPSDPAGERPVGNALAVLAGCQ